MTWLNPWAWAGLVAVALPLLIHFLGRARARTQRFPTLRFVDPSRLLPRRFTRPHDPLLLAVRVAIFVAAVAALARPQFRTTGRARASSDALARAIVVDTGAGLQRTTPTGERAVDAARRKGKRLASEAALPVILETDAPADLIAGAAAWLARQPARGELVVISDFRRGSLNAHDLAAVPRAIGVRLARIEVTPAPAMRETISRAADADIIARATPGPERTEVEWTAKRADARRVGDGLVLLSATGERGRADATLAAAGSLATPIPADTARAVAIAWPGYERRRALLQRARQPREPWMAEVLARLAGPVPAAAQDTIDGRERLVLFADSAAGSVAAAALVVDVARARGPSAAAAELEPELIPAATLAAWERAPTTEGASDGGSAADASVDLSAGRWLWTMVLALLAVEAWLRRAPREQRASA